MAESYARFTAHLLKQYVWGLRYIDAPILRDRETDGGSAGLDERLYYTQDGNFNVTALVNPAGQVVERYSYDAYGQVTVLDGDWSVDADGLSDVDNRILYCGYRFDSETGLYHVRYRYLHPTLGRWITQDPAGYVDGMGLYEYVTSRALSSLDPTGASSVSNVGAQPYRMLLPARPREVLQAEKKVRRIQGKLLDYTRHVLSTCCEGDAGRSKIIDEIIGDIEKGNATLSVGLSVLAGSDLFGQVVQNWAVIRAKRVGGAMTLIGMGVSGYRLADSVFLSGSAWKGQDGGLPSRSRACRAMGNIGAGAGSFVNPLIGVVGLYANYKADAIEDEAEALSEVSQDAIDVETCILNKWKVSAAQRRLKKAQEEFLAACKKHAVSTRTGGFVDPVVWEEGGFLK